MQTVINSRTWKINNHFFQEMTINKQMLLTIYIDTSQYIIYLYIDIWTAI